MIFKTLGSGGSNARASIENQADAGVLACQGAPHGRLPLFKARRANYLSEQSGERVW